MDFPELAKLAFSRVQTVDPENVGKILGCILLREPDEEEMVQLAYGTEADLLAKISDAKATLAAIYARCSAKQQQQHHLQIGAHPVGRVRHFSSPPAALGFHVQSQYSAAAVKDYPPHAFVDVEGHYHNGLDDHHYDGYFYPTPAEDGGLPMSRASCRRPANGLSTGRPCHYFFKGNCKNGQNCHYSHHHQVYYRDEHHHQNSSGTTPGALEALESEIADLLNSRRGQPVSIASLPTLYGEKYGKGLQADGYLTESQRHGKAGYSLTKLLSRLNKIRVIERPHGQHSVILAEDAARYTESMAERGGDIPASSHQIYLTFPAESIFTEEDVANYFGQYGLVRDVRIPCQERRMFGFVSFQNAETVGTILMRRNPHFVCGSRVLVKPYREKSKCIERTTYVDKIKPMLHNYPTCFFDVDPEFYPGEYDTSSRLMRKQLLTEKRERLIELERKRLAGIKLESFPQQFAYFDCSIEDVHTLNSLPPDSKDQMDHPMDPLDIVSTSQAPQTQRSNNYDDQESNQIELLPESPFESAALLETVYRESYNRNKKIIKHTEPLEEV